MPEQTRIVAAGPRDRAVITADGTLLVVPVDWELLPPGDAGMTRRVKKAGPTWTVQKMRGRKKFSLGVWAPAEHIAAIRTQLDAERSTDAYARRREASTRRRERVQTAYVGTFRQSVTEFLAFNEIYTELAEQLADAVTQHATPVGSGTVARTERIPVAQRAESAVIAWLRHQTTAYDQMKIARVKGRRREVRRELAMRSRHLLRAYRAGKPVDEARCPLRQALAPKSQIG